MVPVQRLSFGVSCGVGLYTQVDGHTGKPATGEAVAVMSVVVRSTWSGSGQETLTGARMDLEVIGLNVGRLPPRGVAPNPGSQEKFQAAAAARQLGTNCGKGHSLSLPVSLLPMDSIASKTARRAAAGCGVH